MKNYVAEITSLKVQLSRQGAQHQSDTEHFELRYQNLVAQFYQARADYHKSVSDCSRLRLVIVAKQEVIEVLLPYYPHPLTHELQHKIALQ